MILPNFKTWVAPNNTSYRDTVPGFYLVDGKPIFVSNPIYGIPQIVDNPTYGFPRPNPELDADRRLKFNETTSVKPCCGGGQNGRSNNPSYNNALSKLTNTIVTRPIVVNNRSLQPSFTFEGGNVKQQTMFEKITGFIRGNVRGGNINNDNNGGNNNGGGNVGGGNVGGGNNDNGSDNYDNGNNNRNCANGFNPIANICCPNGTTWNQTWGVCKNNTTQV